LCAIVCIIWVLRYLKNWTDQLKWQRLEPFWKLARMLWDHLDGLLNYCRTKVPLGVVEAVNGNIRSLLRRGRGYKNLRYLLLKAQRMAVTKTDSVVFQKSSIKCGFPLIPAQSLIKEQLQPELNDSHPVPQGANFSHADV